MSVVDELISVLGYKIEGKEKLKEYKAGLDGAEKDATGSASRMAVVGRRIGVGMGLAVTAGAALVKSAVVNYAGFERTLERIGITAGASTAATKAAGDQVQRMAKLYALSTDDAIQGLDTLTASGLSLEQSMAFLPSVLATAQASGAAVNDVANTAIKASGALKIQAKDMQAAFDIMVAGGKAGQFELKDMAAFIPQLANSFSTLGYEGNEGLKSLIAIMQTLRERTGDASTAATQAQNIFGKMLSNQSIKAFKDFGIDLEAGMKKGKAAGEETIETFVRLSKEALKGDLSKLPQLFADEQFRLGMTTLITSADAMERFMKALNSGDVSGGTMRDLARILDNTEAKIQNLSTSWDSFMKSLGGKVAPTVGGALEAATDAMDFGSAIDRGLVKAGVKDEASQRWWKLKNSFDEEERTKMARRGGYASTPQEAEASQTLPTEQYASLGRRINRPVSQTPAYAYGAPEGSASQTNRAPGAHGAQRGALPSSGGIGSDHAASKVAIAQPAMDKSWLSQILSAIDASGQGPAEAMVTDNRTDNRQYPVTVSAPISIGTINEAGAGRAVGEGIAAAVDKGANAAPSRMQEGPVQ